jgi:hypothetical protein
VIDGLGEKVGDITDVQPDYVLVTKGLFFPKDLYVPRGAIEEVDPADQTVVLNVHKSHIDEAKWSHAPAAGSFQTEGRAEEATLRRDAYARGNTAPMGDDPRTSPARPAVPPLAPSAGPQSAQRSEDPQVPLSVASSGPRGARRQETPSRMRSKATIPGSRPLAGRAAADGCRSFSLASGRTIVQAPSTGRGRARA